MQTYTPPNAAELLKIDVKDIKVGMYMSQPDRPWLETSFLFQGILLNNQELIDEVRQECKFIYVDREKSSVKIAVNPTRSTSSSAPSKILSISTSNEQTNAPTKAPLIKTPVERELAAAYTAHEGAGNEVKEVLARVAAGEGINVTRIRKSVNSCVKSIMVNPNAMLWLSKLRSINNYNAEHCLNVGILAVAFGRHLGFGQDQLETLGLCGMLHDVGKMKVDQKILNKPARLSEAEFKVIKDHCHLGMEMLSEDPDLPKQAIEAAWGHHERMDGEGYPRAIKAGSLSVFTRIISIVDTYDAITTNRCYNKSRPATEAMKILFKCRHTQFDAILVEKFIECLGIFPIGSLVELHSGEGAVVIDSNTNSRLYPRVTIVLNEEKLYRSPLIINTATYANDDGDRTIKRVLDENDFPVNMENVFAQLKGQQVQTVAKQAALPSGSSQPK